MPKYQVVKSCLIDCQSIDEPTMVWGPPAIGKTTMNYEVADHMELPVYLLSAEIHQSVDLHGVPVPDLGANVTRWLQPGTLPFIGSDLPAGYIFIDEINRADKDMQSALMPLVLARRIGEHILKPGCRIGAAGNRRSDKAGVNAMNLALISRFVHFHLEPDLESWITDHAVKQSGLGWAILIAFLRLKERRDNKLERLFCQSDNLSADTLGTPNPRSWSKVAKMIDFRDETRFLSVSGQVGEDAASELEGFLQIRREIPSLNDVLHNPNAAPVPHNEGAMFAIAGMLAHCADHSNFDAIMIYAARLGAEFEAMVIADATNRNADLKQHGAYVRWAIANQQYTL